MKEQISPANVFIVLVVDWPVKDSCSENEIPVTCSVFLARKSGDLKHAMQTPSENLVTSNTLCKLRQKI